MLKTRNNGRFGRLERIWENLLGFFERVASGKKLVFIPQIRMIKDCQTSIQSLLHDHKHFKKNYNVKHLKFVGMDLNSD